ncbi:hypothetical protein VA7868_04005 [Vibrio aerogenes CECT 7868]|uniref:DUF2007 domain-containing protein n=1 Tax=Vibrio aerogenes CECT 7868 TaxID=1216006 RepID=A0A1M6CF81_9VIBR|nr:DUF2007 domain-containing protein [Vibrio aerogenes]SHI59652.1 hypothetical protein VA7868_04005 [Vibrio aerogenes CECT 7868]
MVIIARFSLPHEAHIAKASLEAAGIISIIADEHSMINMQWLFNDIPGSIRLLVHESDADNARMILNTDFSSAVDNDVIS